MTPHTPCWNRLPHWAVNEITTADLHGSRAELLPSCCPLPGAGKSLLGTTAMCSLCPKQPLPCPGLHGAAPAPSAPPQPFFTLLEERFSCISSLQTDRRTDGWMCRHARSCHKKAFPQGTSSPFPRTAVFQHSSFVLAVSTTKQHFCTFKIHSSHV